MDHLFSSTVRVERQDFTVSGGLASTSWVPVDEPWAKALRCRLDLNFVRPGKDAIPAPNAGVAPDRVGLMLTSAKAKLKAGDRIVAIPNRAGKTPVEGTFEIRVVPDVALGMTDAHHIEVQIVEVAQKPKNFSWPGEAPTP